MEEKMNYDFNNKLCCEIGKIVVNKCMERGIFINTLKLEKLLILMEIAYIKNYNKSFIRADIGVNSHGRFMIKDVDCFFMKYALEFDEKQAELVGLLESQEYCMEQILEMYGNMDAFDLEDIINRKGLKNFAQPKTIIDTYDMLRIFGNNNKNG